MQVQFSGAHQLKAQDRAQTASLVDAARYEPQIMDELARLIPQDGGNADIFVYPSGKVVALSGAELEAFESAVHDQFMRPQHEARGNFESQPDDTLLGGELPTDQDRATILNTVLREMGHNPKRLPIVKVPTPTLAYTLPEAVVE